MWLPGLVAGSAGVIAGVGFAVSAGRGVAGTEAGLLKTGFCTSFSIFCVLGCGFIGTGVLMGFAGCQGCWRVYWL